MDERYLTIELAVDGGTVTCQFERTGKSLVLADFRATPAPGGGTGRTAWLAKAPISRWLRMARAEVEARIYGYEIATPDDGLRGNAARRHDALIRLARVAQEYRAAEAAGHRNPAAVVGAAHGVSAATVRSWLFRARREGLAAASDHLNATVNAEGV